MRNRLTWLIGMATLAASGAARADGVWIGTRFIATPEARSAPGYKDALLRTAEDGTVISRAFSGKTMRVNVRTRVLPFAVSAIDTAVGFTVQQDSACSSGLAVLIST